MPYWARVIYKLITKIAGKTVLSSYGFLPTRWKAGLCKRWEIYRSQCVIFQCGMSLARIELLVQLATGRQGGWADPNCELQRIFSCQATNLESTRCGYAGASRREQGQVSSCSSGWTIGADVDHLPNHAVTFQRRK